MVRPRIQRRNYSAPSSVEHTHPADRVARCVVLPLLLEPRRRQRILELAVTESKLKHLQLPKFVPRSDLGNGTQLSVGQGWRIVSRYIMPMSVACLILCVRGRA